MDPIEALMAEHRFLERMLEALEQCVTAVEAGDDGAVADAGRFAEVFRGFDRLLHQAKEERLLLPAMKDGGIPEQGLLAAIDQEHRDERELVAGLAAASASGAVQELVETAYAYSDHARCHIYTEETILLPMARKRLTEQSLGQLGEAFACFAQELDSRGEYTGVRELAENLSSRYGTAPACIEPRISWLGADD